ncbi:MAG: ChbG/HpnK family deacetylase, partial [Blastocatellia bacterium]
FLSACAVALAGGSRAFSFPAPRIRLITRGDDLGCARSLNRAMKECYEKGILKNCSVLAATPYVEEAARMLAKAKGLCFGLHCVLDLRVGQRAVEARGAAGEGVFADW